MVEAVILQPPQELESKTAPEILEPEEANTNQERIREELFNEEDAFKKQEVHQPLIFAQQQTPIIFSKQPNISSNSSILKISSESKFFSTIQHHPLSLETRIQSRKILILPHPSMASSNLDMETFLKECSRSVNSAYAALKSILERLENPSTRPGARIFLSELQKRFDSEESSHDCFSRFHFRIHDVTLTDFEAGHHKRNKLTMMEIPSIFVPEDWSFTFYEGINRHPLSIFKDKTVAELGCGNGWISIALADKWSPSKVYGLDINPRAVKIAWINLFLNALDENGCPIFDEEKKTLLDRVEFYESDLLAYCRDNNIQLDRIVGCIPQILNPNPEAMSKLVTENASEEFLHSLSNYCALQGFVEDQFGLGLIARAVEEGIAVINPMGIMDFNMGGRPGQAVCKRLFKRRGFRITKLWQTKILQAADTDISALVEIEKNSHHRFEFFMGLVGDQPICARTAWAYVNSGGQISHSLSVYSCQLRQPNQVNNAYIFPGFGLGLVMSGAIRVHDDMLLAESEALASQVTHENYDNGLIYPPSTLPYLQLVALGGTYAFLLESIFRNSIWVILPSKRSLSKPPWAYPNPSLCQTPLVPTSSRPFPKPPWPLPMPMYARPPLKPPWYNNKHMACAKYERPSPKPP